MFKKLSGMDAQMIGSCTIPLKSLLKNRATITGSARIMSDDENLVGTRHVATIHFVLRMKRPIKDISNPSTPIHSNIKANQRYRNESSDDDDDDQNIDEDYRRNERIKRRLNNKRRKEKDPSNNKNADLELQERLDKAMELERHGKASYQAAEAMPDINKIENKTNPLPLPLPVVDASGDVISITSMIDLNGATKDIPSFDKRLYITVNECDLCDIGRVILNHTTNKNRPFTPFTTIDNMNEKSFFLNYRNYGITKGKTDSIQIFIAKADETDFHALYDNKNEVLSIKEADTPAYGNFLGQFHLPLTLIAKMATSNKGSLTKQEFQIYPTASHKSKAIGHITIEISWENVLLTSNKTKADVSLLAINPVEHKLHEILDASEGKEIVINQVHQKSLSKDYSSAIDDLIATSNQSKVPGITKKRSSKSSSTSSSSSNSKKSDDNESKYEVDQKKEELPTANELLSNLINPKHGKKDDQDSSDNNELDQALKESATKKDNIISSLLRQ